MVGSENDIQRCHDLCLTRSTALAIDDEQLARARELTGVKETTALVRKALTRLILSEASRRLARMGGSDPNAQAGPRRRSEPDPAHADADAELKD